VVCATHVKRISSATLTLIPKLNEYVTNIKEKHMNKLTNMTRALDYYGFTAIVNVTDQPHQEDHEIMISPSIHVQVPSMGDGPYVVWFVDGQLHYVMVEGDNANQIAKHLYNLTKGV
jgi:hypothetical protein